jgi:Flp pilus assembly protein TadD
MFYSFYGLYDDALVYVSKASELSPTKQTILYQLGSLYINKKQFPQALLVFKKAYESEPKNEDALKYYAISALYNGDNKLAESLLVPKYGSINLNDDKFLRYFSDTKQWSRVVAILKQRLETDPNNTTHRSQLASVYAQMGRKAEAVAEVRKVIEINPSMKDQGEAYIREIQSSK